MKVVDKPMNHSRNEQEMDKNFISLQVHKAWIGHGRDEKNESKHKPSSVSRRNVKPKQVCFVG